MGKNEAQSISGLSSKVGLVFWQVQYLPSQVGGRDPLSPSLWLWASSQAAWRQCDTDGRSSNPRLFFLADRRTAHGRAAKGLWESSSVFLAACPDTSQLLLLHYFQHSSRILKERHRIQESCCISLYWQWERDHQQSARPLSLSPPRSQLSDNRYKCQTDRPAWAPVFDLKEASIACKILEGALWDCCGTLELQEQ